MPRHSTRGTRLTPADWRLLAGACVAQGMTALALRVMSLPTLRTVAGRLAPVINGLLAGSDARIIWAVEATGRRLGRLSTCLVRAVVVEARLSSPQRPLRLTIGVTRVASGLRSHAWVADCGRVLIGGPVDPDLVPIIVWEHSHSFR